MSDQPDDDAAETKREAIYIAGRQRALQSVLGHVLHELDSDGLKRDPAHTAAHVLADLAMMSAASPFRHPWPTCSVVRISSAASWIQSGVMAWPSQGRSTGAVAA